MDEKDEQLTSHTEDKHTVLAGMFRDWYLEYASYVILERAVPHIEDGLKPVQRRILHSLYTLDDGRFNKVANIVGDTMKYHPHGDASIGDALVQLGQKELLIDTQGNWGNILTGDDAAAPRYIEARLSEFALETVYSPKVTEWMWAYDGRKKEPVTLPVKFPIVLAQGVEGIAVGLSSKILPHNFNEICDAAVAHLQGEEFTLLPDFQTGGLLDASRYHDGARGGNVKVRAKIEKIDSKTLVITELPFSKTTETLITSIISAQEKGKIKIRSVENNTSATANIVVNLMPGTSSDKAIDALYAFTDCEVSISPNCCVIRDRKPEFLTVSDVLRFNVERTRDILKRELEIALGEQREEQFFASLEKIFIEKRIYKDKPLEEAPDMDTAVEHTMGRLKPFVGKFYRELTRDDILRLWEIKMGRILKFNSKKADDKIIALDASIAQKQYDIEHITDYTIAWYRRLKEKYGERFPRRTVIRGFDSIEAAKVADANKKLYFDAEGGFIGTGLKDKEPILNCSELDDIIIFYKDGTYKIVRTPDKLYIGKNVLKFPGSIRVFKKGDKRTIYNVIYRNGKHGPCYQKRFFITGLTRDKEYNLTKGLDGSEIKWFSANPNGEAETVRVALTRSSSGRTPANRDLDVNFANLAIKGKDALGNLVTKYGVGKITLKEVGVSTLQGLKVWFDRDVLRLNYDGRGDELGMFEGDDKVLVITNDGQYYTTSYAESNHYDDNISLITKFDPHKVWTLVFYNADANGEPYLKRFQFEATAKPQRFVGNDEKSSSILLTSSRSPKLLVHFAEGDDSRVPMEVEGADFVGVKSFKAKGKRLTQLKISYVEELPSDEPEEEEEEIEEEVAVEEITDTEAASEERVIESNDDPNQLSLFDDEI